MDSLTPLSTVPTLTGAAKPGPRKGGVADPVQVAKDFESLLLTKVIEEMAKTVEDSGLDEDGAAQQVHDMFYYNLSQDLAAKGGLGLWKQIARQLGAPASVSQPEQESVP
ncbi:MAG: rod-binding protein [Planctomycetota bacterium]|nr:rod-binding protein [Planctomycetota bacterium]